MHTYLNFTYPIWIVDTTPYYPRALLVKRRGLSSQILERINLHQEHMLPSDWLLANKPKLIKTQEQKSNLLFLNVESLKVGLTSDTSIRHKCARPAAIYMWFAIWLLCSNYSLQVASFVICKPYYGWQRAYSKWRSCDICKGVVPLLYIYKTRVWTHLDEVGEGKF